MYYFLSEIIEEKKNIIVIKTLYIMMNKIFTISMYIYIFLHINIFICNSENKK